MSELGCAGLMDGQDGNAFIPVILSSYESRFKTEKEGAETMKYRIIIEQDEDGVFVVQCPALPGCISQGRTREEAIENIKDAIEGYIESLKKANEPIPPSVMEEFVEIAG